MSNKYKFRDEDKLYFVTFSVVFWIDLLVRVEYKNILLESLKFCCNNKGMELFGYCIMTSHMHMIIGSHGEKLETILRDFKRHTSKELRMVIQGHPSESRRDWLLSMMQGAGLKSSNTTNFQLWQHDCHPIQLERLRTAHQKLEYIHLNPVKEGIVAKPEEYVYSSASNYIHGTGLIDIIHLPPLTH